MSSHIDGQIVDQRAVRLEGSTSLPPGIDVVVDVVRPDGSADRLVANRAGGAFSSFLLLSPGDNRIIVSATPEEGSPLRTAFMLVFRHQVEVEDEPRIQLETPRDGDVIDSSVLAVEGGVIGVQDGAVVQVVLEGGRSSRRQEATVRDGRFRVWFVVEDEQNSLTLSVGRTVEQISFRSTAPRRDSVHQEDREHRPRDDDAPRPSPESDEVVSVVGERRPTRSVIRVDRPEDGSMLTSATLRVEGTVDRSLASSVIVRTLSEVGRDERLARITGSSFSAWFVLRHPQVIVQVQARDDDEQLVGEAVLQVRCSAPRGWGRPLPWESEDGRESKERERSRLATHRGSVADGDVPRLRDEPGIRLGDDGRDSSHPVDEPLDWRLLALPFLVVIGIPVGIRLIALLRSLMQQALLASRRTAPTVCDFCGSVQARRHHLFLASDDVMEGGLMDELIEIAGLTSNDEVNERLRPLLERVTALSGDGGSVEGIPVWCVWCRSCSSGFIIVGTGSASSRHPILTPVFFDWLLVTLGLND